MTTSYRQQLEDAIHSIEDKDVLAVKAAEILGEAIHNADQVGYERGYATGESEQKGEIADLNAAIAELESEIEELEKDKYND